MENEWNKDKLVELCEYKKTKAKRDLRNEHGKTNKRQDFIDCFELENIIYSKFSNALMVASNKKDLIAHIKDMDPIYPENVNDKVQYNRLWQLELDRFVLQLR